MPKTPHEAAIDRAMAYIDANEVAINAQFQRAFYSHPTAQRILSADGLSEKGREKLQLLLNDFYLAGIADVVRFGTEDKEAPATQSAEDAISKLLKEILS